MKRKIKIVLELLLRRLPERLEIMVSLFFNRLKSRLAGPYKRHAFLKPFIRLCDFIVVRTNGDRFIEFELTNICNAQCVFCPYPDMLRTEKKFMNMSEQVLDKTIRKISGFKDALISFTPTTGDTLLHPDWDHYIARVLEQKSISKATMFTNAIKLDDAYAERFVRLLSEDEGKMSQVYFSVGGLDAETYKALYKVDRFDLVRNNINGFLKRLTENRIVTGIHIHVKLLKGMEFDAVRASQLFNVHDYPFVYFSYSDRYFSNDGYKRNAIIDYYPVDEPVKQHACAYLLKTRFAADGGIWADGCVISEMPGDSSLRLGDVDDSHDVIEEARKRIIDNWEQRQIIPKPCQGCTVYRCRRGV